MMRTSIAFLIVVIAASCGKDTAGPGRRGDPFTVIVTHVQFTDTLAQHYDLFAIVDEAGAPPPTPSGWGSVDSSQAANGFTTCFGLGTDSLGARLVRIELRSSTPSPVGDTLRSAVFDPANIPSADSANGYGQTYDRPYYWHWYVANDSNVVRGDTARFQITPDPATICRF